MSKDEDKQTGTKTRLCKPEVVRSQWTFRKFETEVFIQVAWRGAYGLSER
jgi:hypothetical protein